MKKIIYAFRFLTILPIPWNQNEKLTEVSRSVIYFPAVGMTIGGILTILIYLLLNHLTPIAIATIVVFAWVSFTGGLHLDGLSDLFDGFGGKSREHSLRIMKDSSIGAFGAIALIFLILLKVVFVRELIINNKYLFTLLLAPAWGRQLQLLSIRFFPSAREGGMGSFFKNGMKNIDWILPLILLLSISIYLLSISSLIYLVIYLAIMTLFVVYTSKRLGGLTGDCYGAICESSEVLFLILFSI